MYDRILRTFVAVLLVSVTCCDAQGSSSGGDAPLSPHAPLHGRQQQQPHHRRGRFGGKHSGRCIGTTGTWCGGYVNQSAAPHRAPPIHGEPCPGGCSGVGVCHGDSGTCDCPAGWGGPACAAPLKRPCTRAYRQPRNSTAPNGHIGPDMRDLDWRANGSTYSRCAGICDDDIAACYCDPQLGSPKHGRIPPPPRSPPGTPPIQRGRQLFEPCSRLADDGRGGRLEWVGWGVAFDKVYGPEGWCVADEPKVRKREAGSGAAATCSHPDNTKAP
jgi:hypothetical protein